MLLIDMWNAEHERPFSCIDLTTPSKFLCTTRIKGIIPKGLEVELELLGVKGIYRRHIGVFLSWCVMILESVELLAAVAMIDGDQTPPCCLEIAQLASSILSFCPARFSLIVSLFLSVWSLALVLKHCGKSNPHVRRAGVGRRDSVDSEEGHEESKHWQRRQFPAI